MAGAVHIQLATRYAEVVLVAVAGYAVSSCTWLRYLATRNQLRLWLPVASYGYAHRSHVASSYHVASYAYHVGSYA